MATETGSCSAPQTPMCWFQTDLDYNYSLSTVAVIWGLITQYSACGDSVWRVFGEPISPHEVSREFISLHAKPYNKLMCFALGCYEALLGLLNSPDKKFDVCIFNFTLKRLNL